MAPSNFYGLFNAYEFKTEETFDNILFLKYKLE